MMEDLKVALDNLLHSSFKFIRDHYDTVEDIAAYLIDIGLDEMADGFWILDFRRAEYEYYSPKFRSTLGYEGEHDFPNIPASWQDIIIGDDVQKKAIDLLYKHLESDGKVPYMVHCSYPRKEGDEVVDLVCEGSIIIYNEDGSPRIMLGKHHVMK